MPARPTTTRAAILTELNQPLVVDTVGLPDVLDAGQVLVEVHHSGVCGSQLGEVSGVKGPDKWLPHLLGHEGGAVVLETGPGVRHIQVGQRVVMHWRKGLGIDASPATYTWAGSTLPNNRCNSGQVTTFQRHAVVSENRLTPVPEDLPLDLAALFGCPVTTGLGVAINDAQLKPGQSIVVWGAGGVGLNIVQGAALLSACPIIAIDLHDSRLALAQRFGATHTINGQGKSLDEVAQLVERALGGKADVAVDNTGSPAVIRRCYDLTSARGRTVLVGVPKAGEETTLYTLPLHFDKVLTGSHGGDADPPADLPRYLKLWRTGKLDLSSLVTHRYTLEQINEAMADLRSGKVTGRCMIDMIH